MAELSVDVIREVGERLNVEADALATLVTAVQTGQSTWVFGDEEVLPTSAELKANLALYEALTVKPLSLSAQLALVRGWTA